ncbi:MAG TPA: hypothetical protein VK968_10440 [Roseimicrobium sp.]|nr:hypothetical protein [Roseimicrobium sp.]
MGPSKNGARLTRVFLLAIGLVVLGASPGRMSAQDQTRKKTPSAPSAGVEPATRFLEFLGKADVDAAIGFWDGRMINDKLKERMGKMAAKVKRAGGIKRVDVGPCEGRRIKRLQEQMPGETVDVVPVEIICGDESLILAVFSIRKQGDQWRIIQLESLKEWGGTASLDEELRYSN